MALTVQDSRIWIKRSTVVGQVPTVGPTNDHTDGTWSVTDIYEGELFLNTVDNKAYTRLNNTIRQLGVLPTGITTGDMLYVNTSGTLSRLAIGTSGYVVTSNGTIPYYAAGGAGSGTVTSVATAGLISGGTITGAGTITTSMATNKLVGRGTAGTGIMEEITLGTNLSFTGTTLNAAGGGGVTSLDTLTGVLTLGATTDSLTSKATLASGDYFPLADSAAAFASKKTRTSDIAEYVRGIWSDVSGGIAGLTLLKINFKNVADTFTSFFTNTNTASRTYTFPDKDMTVAGTNDVRTTHSFSAGVFSPADSITYYIGYPFSQNPSTVAQRRETKMAYACTLVGASIGVFVGTTLATNENISVYARINNTTDVTLSTTVKADAVNNTYAVTGLSTAIAANDLIEVKYVTPAWLTNPTNFVLSVTLYFQP